MEVNPNPSHGSVSSPSGGLVKPVYSEREMKCLTVTESELKQIGLANLGVTVCVGIGSAFLAFGFDIFKDVMLTDDVPESAILLTQYVQPLCLGMGFVFYLVAGVLWWWRRDMIGLIRRES